jgi:anthranilate phosphoribosyltransferase
LQTTPDAIKTFGFSIQRLIDGQNLTREETYGMFEEILANRQPELQQGAFLAALAAKGETTQEIAGAWQAVFDMDTLKVTDTFDGPIMENSGTGRDSLKTFNVSTAAAVIAAAGGVRLARHGARAITSRCGTVDLMESLGLDVECSIAKVCKSIRETGIGLFNGMSPYVHPAALGRILQSIRFGSILNISASLASPCRPTHALRGVYTPALVSKMASVLREIGYERGMVVYGFDGRGEKGIDELSNMGKSLVCEFDRSGNERTYEISPEEMGLRRVAYPEIASLSSPEAEAVRFIQVLGGKGSEACTDLACLNAGAIFYLIGSVNNIRTGIDKGRELIANGKAIKKLAEWIDVQGNGEGKGLHRLAQVVKAAGIPAYVP